VVVQADYKVPASAVAAVHTAAGAQVAGCRTRHFPAGPQAMAADMPPVGEHTAPVAEHIAAVEAVGHTAVAVGSAGRTVPGRTVAVEPVVLAVHEAAGRIAGVPELPVEVHTATAVGPAVPVVASAVRRPQVD